MLETKVEIIFSVKVDILIKFKINLNQTFVVFVSFFRSAICNIQRSTPAQSRSLKRSKYVVSQSTYFELLGLLNPQFDDAELIPWLNAVKLSLVPIIGLRVNIAVVL